MNSDVRSRRAVLRILGSSRRLALAAAAVMLALSLLVAVPASAQSIGELQQFAGGGGCVSETGSAGQCTDAKALIDPLSVAVTPDGTGLLVASDTSDAVAVFQRSLGGGGIVQLSDTLGCVSETGTSGQCADGRALNGPRSVAVSPDSKNVYAASFNSDAVAVFARDTTTNQTTSGQLTQLTGTAGCVSETGAGGCTDGKALDAARSVAVSPDGNHVYVASFTSDAVAVFQRDATTGALTQLPGTAGCVSETGSGGQCADGKALADPNSVTVSPDGVSVYVTSGNFDSVAVFRRDATTGALTQLPGTAGCVSETGSAGQCIDGKALDGPQSVAVSGEGTRAYVASFNGDSVAVFSRNTATGGLAQLTGTPGCVSETGSGGQCADGKALDGARSVAVSADRKSVYVAASGVSNAVAVFSRNTATGVLTQLAGTAGCVSETGSGGQCADGKGLTGAAAVAISADAKNVYVGSLTDDAVAAFVRTVDPTGKLTQLLGTAGCVSETGTSGQCVDGRGLDGASSVAVSADGKNVYVASSLSDAVAAFQRSSLLGGLTQLMGTAGCISETGTSGQCADGRALRGANSVAVTADGTFVYVAARTSDAVAVLQRDPTTGQLSQAAGTGGCASETGSGGLCNDRRALDDPLSVAVSPDGRNVYVASVVSDAVAVFARDASTGRLTHLAGSGGCVSETGSSGCADGKALDGASAVAVSPDGENVYVAAQSSHGVAIFQRNTTTGALTQLTGTAGCVSEDGSGGQCADGKALLGARSVAVHPDGFAVFVTSLTSGAINVFQRDDTTGALTQPTGTSVCASKDGSSGQCQVGTALSFPISVAVSGDGQSIYVTDLATAAVLVFEPSDGGMRQLPGTAGCVSETGSSGQCTNGKALVNAASVAVSPDAKSVYVAAAVSDAVAIFERAP